MAGMASADRTVSLLIRHPAITRSEAAEVLRQRWPGTAITEVGAVEPSWSPKTEDAVEIALARRGVEPIRVVILAQHKSGRGDPLTLGAMPTSMEPMPTMF
jgi:hypothetical protein